MEEQTYSRMVCGPVTFIKVSGGRVHERDMVYKVVLWCMKKFDMYHEAIRIDARIKKLKDDAGYCEEKWEPVVNDEGHISAKYQITVAQNQMLRDFVMTIVHEMIHVRQYVSGRWHGDGEAEAWALQESYTDELWRENII